MTHRGDLDRAAIAEFIQYGNGHSTAAYDRTFTDKTGAPLDGSTALGYMLMFSKREPEAQRFGSVTAYIPESITLLDNPANNAWWRAPRRTW